MDCRPLIQLIDREGIPKRIIVTDHGGPVWVTYRDGHRNGFQIHNTVAGWNHTWEAMVEVRQQVRRAFPEAQYRWPRFALRRRASPPRRRSSLPSAVLV